MYKRQGGVLHGVVGFVGGAERSEQIFQFDMAFLLYSAKDVYKRQTVGSGVVGKIIE